MKTVSILWDASHLWGLLVWHALEIFKVPYQIVTAKEIACNGLSKSTSLLIVPGGTARHKALALGELGRKNILEWVRNGGNYLGFCGGSGLGLTDTVVEHSLGLCSWRRAEVEDRLHHMVSGHIPVVLDTKHRFVPENIRQMNMPVWWPSRFAVPQDMLGVDVLATYTIQSLKDCPKGLCIADLSLSLLSERVVHEWLEDYGVNILPLFLHNQPCIISGNNSKGTYVLSYAHLETPGSLDANSLFVHILRELLEIPLKDVCIPEWNIDNEHIIWDDPVLVAARKEMDMLFQLGLDQGLLFYRTSWLTGWRAGLPGMALNNIKMALCAIMSKNPNHKTQMFWEKSFTRFNVLFNEFRKGVETFLLAQRLAGIVHHAVSLEELMEQKLALFGTAMESNGLYKELLSILDEVSIKQLDRGNVV